MLDPSRPVARLPLELVVHIFALALPSPGPPWTAFPARARWLCTASSLSRSWRSWAQRELVRHVVLRDDEAARAFARGARAAVKREGNACETLRMGGTTAGWPMDGAWLRVVLETAQAGGDELSELWLVTVKGVDLRELKTLNNLRILICVDLELGLPPSSPQTPVPSTRPCLPRLKTLILKDIELAPSLRTIMFEDHQFPSLETLYFDSHEVLTQVFDGDPDAMPRLRAISPAGDIQPAYLEALHPLDEAVVVQDDQSSAGPPTAAGRRSSLGSSRRGSMSRRHSVGSGAAGDEGQDGGNLRLLNLTAPFLRHLAHFAPSLPLGITHLRLDFGPADDLSEAELRLLVDNPDFLELFDPPHLHADPSRRNGIQFLSTSGRRGTPGITNMFFGIRVAVGTVLHDRGVEWCADTPDSFDTGAEVDVEVAPQDTLVPWGFLRAARDAMTFDGARRRAAAR
ncbi:hypothetical protein JCM3775_002560 [Rhodotorula graminis]